MAQLPEAQSQARCNRGREGLGANFLCHRCFLGTGFALVRRRRDKHVLVFSCGKRGPFCPPMGRVRDCCPRALFCRVRRSRCKAEITSDTGFMQMGTLNSSKGAYFRIKVAFFLVGFSFQGYAGARALLYSQECPLVASVLIHGSADPGSASLDRHGFYCYICVSGLFRIVMHIFLT